MPELSTSLPAARCVLLEEFARSIGAPPETKESQCHGRRTSPIRINGDRLIKARKAHADHVQPYQVSGTKARGRGARANPAQSITPNAEPPPHPPSRKPGSSIYYGVRFRPDLNKWVAEIRVAEWKAVDKKVWLGTFDTEMGAARGVDLARKLLKCKKKHGYNLPCSELDAYSGQIPAHLVLTDVTTSSMFRAATLFIKRECQEYAARFHDHESPNSPTSLITHDHHIPSGTPSMINHMVSQAHSFDSDIVDEVGNENSDSDHESGMFVELYDASESISVNDYLNDDYSTFDQTTMSQLGTSPSSCSTTTSCRTFDQCMDPWDMSSGPSFGDAGCIMSTGMMQDEMPYEMQGGMTIGGMEGGVECVMPCGLQGEMQGAVSQECGAEVQCSLPGPGTASFSELAPLPGSYFDMMIPFMSFVDDTPMSCDDISFRHFPNYPFQNGSTAWC